MPFQSEAQRRYMHAKHPKIAARWEKEEKSGKYKKKKPTKKDMVKALNKRANY